MTPTEIKQLQARLNELQYDAGPADGKFGGRTESALKQFQANNGLKADGIYGPLSAKALASGSAKPFAAPGSRPPVASSPVPKIGAPKWPTQSAVREIFGAPGNPKCTAGKAKLPIPFRIAWDLDQKVSSFSCHELVADPLTEIFAKAVAKYGEAQYRKLGLDLFGGCYNLRTMRGGTSYSMHSWGIAVDLDPARNALNWGRKANPAKGYPAAQFAKPEYDDFWAIVEASGAISLGRHADYDWMHFQFARFG